MPGKTPIRFTVRDRTPEDVARVASRYRGNRLFGREYVRVDGERIRAQFRESRSPTPMLRGVLTATSRGTRIEGHVHFGSANLFNYVFVAAAVLMTAAAVVVGVTDGGAGPLALCVVSAVLLWFVALGLLIVSELSTRTEASALRNELVALLEDREVPDRPSAG
ncbi:hypothetical protein [Nocardioides sp. W7]|uniref:hypothetical protein n=1 Tax=Nocardioides sp. W7 TaxID=2931390 RepID=UPI001FD2E814|nr:hypothetical protein [Nocardioides sp. W7]